MNAWVCPDCGRGFARARQGHECAPALTLEEYFATGPDFERPIFDAVVAHLRTLGEPELEPVSVGIFVKRSGVSVAQLRPMTKWVAVSMWLDHTETHPRIARKPARSGRRVWHVVNVRSPDDVDETLTDWLSEAWDTAGGEGSSTLNAMVSRPAVILGDPDDLVDVEWSGAWRAGEA